MAELRKCSRCRSEILLTYFAINRKGEHNKTCETCLNKTRKTKLVSNVPSDFKPLKRTDTDFVDDIIRKTAPDTSDYYSPNVFKTRLSKIKMVEQHYKFKIKDILNIRESNSSNITYGSCSTFY